MVTNEEIKRTPQNPKNRSTQAVSNQVTSQNRGDSLNDGKIIRRRNDLFSPTFKSVAELAGWDEEALLLASLVVEDTPEREKDASNKKKRSRLILKTPPSNSRRTRRAQRRSPEVIPVSVLNLDDDDDDDSRGKGGEIEKQKKEVSEAGRNDAKKLEFEEDKPLAGQSFATSCSSLTIPDMDRLREELSCAICLEICFEPSTTPCGHSFCKKCLRSAADKCGKRCPKCRQLISNGRSCTVNTVLWNTVQLLFPKEVDARKAAGALNVREAKRQSPMSTGERARIGQQHHNRYRSVRHNGASRSGRGGDDDGFRGSTRRSGGVVASQDGDAALALRLQREEFMVEYRGGRRTNDEQNRSSFSTARENLRAIASRAARLRNRPISS